MVLLSLRGTKQSPCYEYKSPKIASSFLLAMTDTLSSKNVNDGNYVEQFHYKNQSQDDWYS